MSLPSLRLKANADRRLRAGHLWVYSNEIDVAATPLHGFKAGDQAILEAAGGKPLGVVALSPNNLICARLLSRDAKLPLDKSLLVHRLNVALSRAMWAAHLVHSPALRSFTPTSADGLVALGAFVGVLRRTSA